MTTRRDFLASGGTAGIALLPGWVPLFGDDTDSTDDRVPTTDEREDEFGMEVDYPEGLLQEYRPAFVASRTAMQKSLGLYAHRVRYDDEDDGEYLYYWHRMSHQDGVSFGPLSPESDAHLYDHEPAIVRLDESGNIDRVTYTFYHHFADVADDDQLVRALQSRATSENTHIQLRIIDPWHNYAVVEGNPELPVTYKDVTSGDAPASHLRTWERRGIFDSTADEAVWDPRTVHERGSWWDESTSDYRVARLYLRLGQYVDIAGSGEAIQ